MANNYSDSSSFIPVPREKLEQAFSIVERVESEINKLTEAEGYHPYVGCTVSFSEDNAPDSDVGVYICGDTESVNMDHVEMFVRALVDELQLEGVHVCSFAYWCDKQRLDQFGGGAFAVVRNFPTVYVDAAAGAELQARKYLEKEGV
jgi:hypothetical protein